MVPNLSVEDSKIKSTTPLRNGRLCNIPVLSNTAPANIRIINEHAQINDCDKANNTTTYEPGLGLPLSVFMKLKPTFELSNEKLLRKCLHGLTQNQNESFNRTI